MTYQTIDLDLSGRVARLTLRRPSAANSIDLTMAEELWHASIACEESPHVRALLVTGSGRFFSAGGDLGSFAKAGPDIGTQLARMTRFLHGAFSKLVRMDAPIVVAVNGPAAGAGLSLTMIGDIVLGARSAHFSSAYIAAGLTPDGSSTYWLPRLVGYRRAQELILLNRRLSADEALEWGLLTSVVEDDELLERATGIAETLAAGPLQAIGVARRLLLASLGDGYETQMEHEGNGIRKAALGPEGQEGIRAFLEKRPADFLKLGAQI